MSLLSRNNRGLLGQGPLAVMQAAQQRRAAMLKPQAPRVIPAGTSVIREADPLRGFSEGMAKFARGVFGDPTVRANREAMASAMAPETVSQKVVDPGGFRVPGPPGSTPVYQDPVDPLDPGAAGLREMLKDPAMARRAARMTGTTFVPDQESAVTAEVPASYSTVVARLNAAGRPDLAQSFLTTKAAEATLGDKARGRLEDERKKRVRREVAELFRKGDKVGAIAKLLELGSGAVDQALAQSINQKPRQQRRYMDGALTIDEDGNPVWNQDVLAIQKMLKEKAREDKPWTTAQGKTATYATRMWSAMQTIEELSDFATTAAARVQGAAAGLGLNFLTSEQSQRLEQAKRNFGVAVLRDESGAAISTNEFIELDKQYFPQHGDSPEVVAQKKRNMQDQLNTLLMAAHPSFKLPKRRRPARGAPSVPKWKVVPDSYEDEVKVRFDGVELDERELRALNRSN